MKLNRMLSIVGIIAVAVVASLTIANPAEARDPSTTISVRTTDSGPIGATAVFWGDWYYVDKENPEVLGACDKQKDGLRAYAEVRRKVNGSWKFFASVEDANGAGNGCRTMDLPHIPDGETVRVKACLKNGAGGALRYCNTGLGVA